MADGKVSVIHLSASASDHLKPEEDDSGERKEKAETSDPKGRRTHALTSVSTYDRGFKAYKAEVVNVVVRLSVVFFFWLLGAWGFSSLWLVVLVALMLSWERRQKRLLRKATLAEHMDDTGLVLAHTRELPSWVSLAVAEAQVRMPE